MMSRIVLLSCVLLGSWASAAELGVLVAVMDHDTAQQKRDVHGRFFPVFERVHEGVLFDQLQKEASSGFTATMLALDELAQRRAGARTLSPTWLYLSAEEGGFARTGFWLRDAGTERFVNDPFVDLVVDTDSVTHGDFEEIFAHEMGHVLLRRLLPRLPAGYSRTAHASLSITDYPTAFDEGFATHFQSLARYLTQNESLHAQDLGLEFKPLLPYWLSNIDRATRIDGIRHNWFVQSQIALPGTGDALMRFDVSNLFDTARLKTGNQMMASEGVIATLFYRWLVPGSADKASLLKRYDLAFAALSHVNQKQLNPDSLLFLDLADSCREVDANEGARLLALIVDTTYGATADSQMARQVEELATHGRTGDMEVFVASLGTSRKQLAALREAVTQSPAKIRAALGPDLWLLTDVPVDDGKNRLSINLNSAEVEGLMKIPGATATMAERALASRREEGAFRDVNDFVRRAGLDAAATRQITAMATALQAAGTYQRR